MIAILRRCPFTLLMVAALVVAGIYGKTQLGSLDVDVRRQAGYSVRLLFDGHLHRLITLVFFTAGGWRFCRSLVLLAGSVGWIESSTVRAGVGSRSSAFTWRTYCFWPSELRYRWPCWKHIAANIQLRWRIP